MASATTTSVSANSSPYHCNAVRRKQPPSPVDEEDSEECVVCLDPLFDEEAPAVVVQLPCRHRFHEACISRVMRYQTRITLHKTASCPCCRYQLYAAGVPPADAGDLEADERHRAACLSTCRTCFYAAFAVAFVVFMVLVWVLSRQASLWR